MQDWKKDAILLIVLAIVTGVIVAIQQAVK